MEKKALTKKEACELMGIAMGTLDKLIKGGKLRWVRVGERGVRIATVELERFLSGEVVNEVPIKNCPAGQRRWL